MKLFIYKSLIIIFLVFILFEITIGYRITNFKAEIDRNSIINKQVTNSEKLIKNIKPEEKEETMDNGMSIKEAKKELSKRYEIPTENIEINIKG